MISSGTFASSSSPSVISRLAATFVIVLGVLVLVGWNLQNETIKRLLPLCTAMNPLTACCFIISGLALLLLTTSRRDAFVVAKVSTILLILIGTTRIIGYISPFDLGLDQILFSDQLASAANPTPNRMAPNTAINFVLLGASLFFLSYSTVRAPWKSHAPAFAAALLSLVAIIGYTYRAPQLYSIAAFIPIAIHTAIGFLVLVIGILAARHSGGLKDIQTRLLSKIYAGYFAIIVLMMVIVGILLDSRVQETYIQMAEQRLRGISILIAEIVADRGHADLQTFDLRAIRESLGENYLHLTLFDTQGNAVSDSQSNSALLNGVEDAQVHENHQESEIYQDGEGRLSLFLTIPIFRSGSGVIGFARAGMPLSDVGRSIDSFRTALLIATASAFILALTLGHFFARRVTRPLFAMTRVAEAIAEGNFKALPSVAGHDEIAALGRSLRVMMDKLSQQVASLERARSEADAANNAKSIFLAHVTHEIRTPLTAVIGVTGLLLRTKLTEKQRRFVELAQNAGTTLNTLINNILDLSKAEAGKMELEVTDFDLLLTVEEVIELLNPRASAKGLDLLLHLERNVPTLVLGDAPRIKQILVNLIGNAVKFTEKGEITLRVSLQEETESNAVLRFEVQDSGSGISEESASKLFQPFAQADTSTSRTHGGTGLGLSLSKQLVELMHGSIGVSSVLNRGSTFWFTIQVEKQAASGQRFSSQPQPRLLQFKVIVIDQNPKHQALMREQLEGWGMEVDVFTSEVEALSALEQAYTIGKPYKVVLLEMTSKALESSLIAQAVKDNAHFKDLVLIALLTLHDDLDSTMLRQHGFANYLTKPVRQSALLDTLMVSTYAAWYVNQPITSSKREESQLGHLPKGRILLVEDNIANQIVAGEIISALGFSYDIAGNGAQAYEAAINTPYDLILMDCQMPVMDGFEATRSIRAEELRRNQETSTNTRVPIIALTANAAASDRDFCLKAGMDDYCGKPIDEEKLVAVLRRYIGGGGTKRVPSISSTPIFATASDASIDFQSFAKRCMYNYESALKALGQFEQQLRTDTALLGDAIRDANYESVDHLAHALKGVNATIGASTLRNLCGDIQTAARNSDGQRLQQLYSEFAKEAQQSYPLIAIGRSEFQKKLKEQAEAS